MAGEGKDRTNEEKVRLRWTEPDFLRSLAFFGVVAQHILGAWSRRPGLGPFEMAGISTAFELVRFAVPLFVFLFGMMLARSAVPAENTGFEAGRYYRKRFVQLVIPYILWSAFYVVTSESGRTLTELPGLLLTGEAEYHLWYVPMILQFVLFAPLFVKLFRHIEALRDPRTGWFGLIAAGYLWLAVLSLCRTVNHPAAVFLFRHQTAFFLSWLVYFAAGAACGAHYEDFCKAAKTFFLPCLVLITGALAFILRADFSHNASAGSVSFNIVGLQRIDYVPVVLVFIFCLQRVAMLFAGNGALRRLSAFVSSHSYRAYLCHVAFIRTVNRRLVTHFGYYPPYYLLLFVLMVLLSLTLAFLFDSVFRKLQTRFDEKRDAVL